MTGPALATVPDATIRVRISARIQHEYQVRSVFGGEDSDHPEVPDAVGMHDVPKATAEAILRDAEYQTSRDGPYGTENRRDDLPTRNAYVGLIKQLRTLLVIEASVHGR